MALRHFSIYLMTFFLSACFWKGGSDLPLLSIETERFPEEGIVYKLSGAPETNLMKLINFLSDKGIRYRLIENETVTHLISSPLAEPLAKGETKKRRTSYRFSVRSGAIDSLCVFASITWLVESQTAETGLWAIDPAEVTYQPVQLTAFQKFFKKNRCE